MILLFTPIVIIMSRRYFMEEATNEYARFALSKGVSENKVYAKHISRNALTFIIKDIPKDLALSIFGFSMITETQ
jgi:oligopeptide transport system permease protein